MLSLWIFRKDSWKKYRLSKMQLLGCWWIFPNINQRFNPLSRYTGFPLGSVLILKHYALHLGLCIELANNVLDKNFSTTLQRDPSDPLFTCNLVIPRFKRSSWGGRSFIVYYQISRGTLFSVGDRVPWSKTQPNIIPYKHTSSPILCFHAHN